MQRIIEVWETMPSSEKIGAIVFPPVFMAIFCAVWVMLP